MSFFMAIRNPESKAVLTRVARLSVSMPVGVYVASTVSEGAKPLVRGERAASQKF